MPLELCSKGLDFADYDKGMLARPVFSSGIAYADVYVGLHTPGCCLREVLFATVLLKINRLALDVVYSIRGNHPH